jgi:Ca2+-binding RTX toxin-like protein
VAADHVTISVAVSATIKKLTPSSAHVKVSWGIACNGEGGDPRYSGDLKLVDLATAEEIYLGGVFSASGDAVALVERRATRRRLRPEIRANCGKTEADGAGHGSETVEAVGPAVVIPPKDRGGNGGGGVGGRAEGGNNGGGGAGDPLGAGGCTRELRGTPGRDVLEGRAGGDLIFALGGADRVRGKRGHDCLVGGPGGDRLVGEEGNDRLTGGTGGDRIDGGPGRNAYDAGAGDDRIKARNGWRELVRCGPGKDSVRADSNDRLRGCERVALRSLSARRVGRWRSGAGRLEPLAHRRVATLVLAALELGA